LPKWARFPYFPIFFTVRPKLLKMKLVRLKIFFGDLAPDFAAQRHFHHTHPSQHNPLPPGTADAPDGIAFGTELVGKIEVDR